MEETYPGSRVRARILACAKYLRAPIPQAVRKRARPQKTFATLTKGRLLENTELIQVGKVEVPAGTLWTVVETTSDGASLRQISDVGHLHGHLLRDKMWRERGLWATVRKTSKRAKEALGEK